jgi:hypothetical protein
MWYGFDHRNENPAICGGPEGFEFEATAPTNPECARRRRGRWSCSVQRQHQDLEADDLQLKSEGRDSISGLQRAQPEGLLYLNELISSRTP